MTLEFIDNSINKKLKNNENIIVYTFFELRVKENLSEEQVERFIELIEIKLINLNYIVYKSGQEYMFDNTNRIVKENELLVAIKNRN